MPAIEYHPDQKTVKELIEKYKDKELNLNPGFQRASVWKRSDRIKLIDSIIKNYPLPSIFLYKREKDGEIIYDVVDGKQRIETLLMYMGIMQGNRFSVSLQLPGSSNMGKYFWKDIVKEKKQYLIKEYKLHVIEINGEPADIIDLFVRINSTGKALSAAEKRHAKYYNSNLLKTAAKIANKYRDYFIKNKILSRDQISRMKHVELICELMISIHNGDVINKKIALNKVMEAESISRTQVKKVKLKTVAVINRIKGLFPELSRTRFSRLSDFYSLTVLVSKFENEKLVLHDKKRNRLAWDILVVFSNGVDKVRERQKESLSIKKGLELQRDYLSTVTQKTDDISQRKARENILRKLLQNVFEKKDSKRTFSIEQRRLLWNTSIIKKCKNCKKELTWQNFTIDHIDPYSKGGRTKLDNAAIMCQRCNSKKGNQG